MSSEFGALLKHYRRKSEDPLRGGQLTQERLADLLFQYHPLHEGYSHVTISNWERGEGAISKDRRDVLTTLIAVLHDCGGLQSLDEAQEFLYAGNYRRLDKEEIDRIDKEWRKQYHSQHSDNVLTMKAGGKEEREQSKPSLSLNKIIAGILGVVGRSSRQERFSDKISLYPSTCGDQGINLDQQRLLVSTAFGTYFAGLLERPQNYIDLEGQINYPVLPEKESLKPLERIYWALQYPRGPQVLVIAAEGGMGKSTLAARIARCFYQEQGLDLLLGDSAKTERMDVKTADVVAIEPEVKERKRLIQTPEHQDKAHKSLIF